MSYALVRSRGNGSVERITISVSDQFAAELAAFMQRERYENRSEAVRDLARLGLKTRALRD